MTTSSKMIAKFIVKCSKEPISNLKLQKLLYYAQGWNLGLRGKPLFMEEIQAWVHGPVVPDVFFHYRHFRWTPIEIPKEPIEIEASAEKHVQVVMRAYGIFTAQQLETLSHSEAPWLTARGSLPPNAPSCEVITHDSMREYFCKLAHGKV